MGSGWLNFKIRLPSCYQCYQETYDFKEMFVEVLRVLNSNNISVSMVREKYERYGEDKTKKFFDVKITLRSKPEYKKWENCEEISYLMELALEILDHPRILERKLVKGLYDEFTKVSEQGDNKDE